MAPHRGVALGQRHDDPHEGLLRDGGGRSDGVHEAAGEADLRGGRVRARRRQRRRVAGRQARVVLQVGDALQKRADGVPV